MSIPAGVTHVVFGGDLPGGERWQSGFWVSGAVPADAGVATANADLWWAQLTAADASGAMRVTFTHAGSSVSMRYVRVYPYPSGGPIAPYVGEHTGSIIGASTDTLPNQCALVVTLRTALSGRRHRGRMYLPVTGLPLGSSGGQANTAHVTEIADAWGTCFSDWNASGDNGKIVVVSPTGSSFSPVTTVSVDTRIDIQRRRANKQSINAVKTHAVTA